MKNKTFKNLFNRASLIAVFYALTLSCTKESEVVEVVEVVATITIYMPDGTTKVVEATSLESYDSSTRTYWKTIDGRKHSTTLPVLIDNK